LDFAKNTFFRARSSALLSTPNLEDQVPVFMFQVTGLPSYTPRRRVPFSSASTTVRAAVVVF
jgi:hypothetical protein